MKILLALALSICWAVALPTLPSSVAGSGLPASHIVAKQPPQPEEAATPRRVSLPVALALACTCNLSVIALLGSIALRRRIDRINPDK